MNAALAWEQYRLARLFLEDQLRPKTLLVASTGFGATSVRMWTALRIEGFPSGSMTKFLERLALSSQSAHAGVCGASGCSTGSGLKPARIPANGFEVFVPPESAYDPVKARGSIWQGRAREIKP